MFTKQEASRIKEEFWTAFGRYMSPVPSAEGVKINWVNYHTRIKDLYFRMNADRNNASICISMEHRDTAMQQLFFEQFLELKNYFHATLGEEWEWQLHTSVSDKTISRICKEIKGVSVLNKNDWPELISFFKPRIIGLDAFWENAKWNFEDLR